MNTSFFDNYKGKNAISIAGKCPEWYKGKQYKKLAPKYSWWEKWHNGEYDNQEYIRLYYETVLNKLDPIEVLKEMCNLLEIKFEGVNQPLDIVILCWETPEKFCHRHIVAEWLERELGIVIVELSLCA